MGTTVQVGRDFTIYYATGSAEISGLFNHFFGSGLKIGLCNVLSYTVEENTEAYHGAGRRHAWGIKGGALDYTVHLEGLWIDSGAHKFFLNESEKTGALTSFAIGASGTERGIAFSGCKMSTLDAEFTADGWATQSIDIVAMQLT